MKELAGLRASGADFDRESFPERMYIDAFPEVRRALQEGEFSSAFEHYLLHGRKQIVDGTLPSPFGFVPILSRPDGIDPRPGLSIAEPVTVPPTSAIADPETPALAAAPSDAAAPSPALASAASASAAVPGAAVTGADVSGAAVAGAAPAGGALPAEPASDAAEPSAPSADAAERFVEELYLALNPDVAAAVRNGDFATARDHWEQFGRDEEIRGIRPTIRADQFYDYAPPPPAQLTQEVRGFDSEGYLYLYPDVREAVGDNLDAARDHWVNHGRFEGRFGPGVAPYSGWRSSPGAVLSKPFGFNVFGPFAATSGLGTAARSLLRAIRTTGIPFAIHPYDVSHGPARILQQERERRPRYRINLILANADQIAQLTSLYPAGFFDDSYNITVWAWELAAFRPDWFASFGAVDEVWTNSDFELAAISAMAPVPVHKIRLPVEVTPRSREEGRAVFAIPQDRLVFLVVFDVGSTSARKNPGIVVEAFREAFRQQENVFLVVKFHSNNIEPQITRQLTRALRGAENVLVIAERLSEDEMQLLQAACDCLVSAHRSEGFGLNIAEFMALGKPVIATNYSGNLEFFDEETGYPLDYKLVEIEQQAGPYMPGYVWADPLPSSLVRRFREVWERQDEARERGRRAAHRLARDFGIERIGRDIEDRVRAIGLDTPLPPFLLWLGRSREICTPPLVAPLSAHSRNALTALTRRKPTLSVIVPVYNVPVHYLEACISSVREQSYPFWELCLCNDASDRAETVAYLDRLRGSDPRIRVRHLPRNLGIAGASNAAAEMATGEFLVMLDNDDVLAPDALLEVARAVNEDDQIDCIYTDEDKIDENGNPIDHYYKPDWSPEHLESVMYVLHMLVVRKRIFLQLGGFRHEYSGAQDYDLMLRVSRVAQKIHHIPKPLYHWRAIPGSSAQIVDAKPYALKSGFRALEDHVREKYEGTAWVEEGLLPGTFRVRRQILGTPRVSVVILTNNGEIELAGRPRFRMIDNLVSSILEKTSYPNYEIVVVDNRNLSPEQLASYRERGVRVEHYRGPVKPFNYANKANFAVRQCRTEHIVMLNDDMEVINADWLTALLEISQDPEIGIVGGRLLHADGTIQHVGTVIGINGGTAHIYHSFPGEFIGYNGFTHLIRNYSAMTGACIATRKSVLAQVGGLDESFAVDFNDTDLCLKIVEAGYRIVYTPYCEMYHYESISQVRTTQDSDERHRFVSKWSRYVENDPFYNVNLARHRFDYGLREA